MGRWSVDEDQRLVALIDAGNSASEVAAALPQRSRNAVIGRIHRIRGTKFPHVVAAKVERALARIALAKRERDALARMQASMAAGVARDAAVARAVEAGARMVAVGRAVHLTRQGVWVLCVRENQRRGLG